MKIYIYTSLLVLGLQGVSAEALRAQNSKSIADTLRRSLSVMTTERSTFATRQPLVLEPIHPQARYAQVGGASAPHVVEHLEGLLPRVEALETVTPLPELFAKRENKGYVSADFGLRYNARLLAGFRAINRGDELLDLSLSGLWSRYEHGYDAMNIPVKEWGLSVGSHWAKSLTGSNLELSVSARHGSHNLYGTPLLHSSLGLAREAGQSLLYAIGNQSLSHTLVKADFALRSSQSNTGSWRYRFNPTLIYANKGDLSELSARAELNLGRELLAGHLVGVKFIPHLLRYSTKDETANKGSMSISVSPYWETATQGYNLAWTLRAGVGVSALSRFYDVRNASSEESDKLWAIYPMIRGRVYSIEHRWDVEASLSGGERSNAFSTLLETSPQLVISSLAPAGLVRFASELKGSFSPLANLRLGLHAGYEVVDGHSDPLVRVGYNQALPQSSYFTYGYRGIETKHISVGGSMAYEAQSLFRITTHLTYHSWFSDQVNEVGGVPKLVAGIDLGLRPLSALKLNLGYELQHGIKYMAEVYTAEGSILSNLMINQRQVLVNLPAMHYLRASATYMLAERWDLLASGSVNLNASGVRHLGYPLQNVAVSLGASYRF